MKTNIILIILISLFFISCKSNDDKQKERNIGKKIIVNISNKENAAININDFDTVEVNNYELIFQKADSILFPDYYLDQKWRNRIYDSTGNSHDYAKTVEKNYLAKQLNLFQRNGDTLILNLLDGKQSIITHKNKDTDGIQSYYFDNYIKNIEYYMLFVQYYEGGEYLLVNKKNGHQEGIIGLPFVSPSLSKLLAINCDLYANYSTNGIEMLSLIGDSIQKDFTLKISNWGPTHLIWISNNKIIIKRSFYEPNKSLLSKFVTMTIDKK